MQHSRGFTLVELAVVITIIAMLLGLVMTGQSILQGSRVRSAQSQAVQYIAAAKQFQDKYQFLPGDFPHAVATWSGFMSCATSNMSTGNQTCNGNGDGAISQIDCSGSASAGESFHAWKHLSNAELINFSFDTAHPYQLRQQLGPLKGTGYTFKYIGTTSGASCLFDGEYGNTLLLGNYTNPALSQFSSADALKMDIKMDDGLPATGAVRGYVNSGGNYMGGANCTDNTSSSAGVAAKYNISNASNQCSLIFLMGL